MIEKIFSMLAASTAVQTSGRLWSPMLIPSRSTSGVDVTEESALSYSAVFAAVKVISETLAMLPWHPYQQNGRSREVLSGSALDVLLHRKPNDDMTAFQFREYLVASALLHGNAYAEIVRSTSGDPVALYPLDQSRITPKRGASGDLFYEVRQDSATVAIPAYDMFHLRGPTRDGIVGWSVISLARESIGGGIAAERFAGGFFGNSGIPSLALIPGDNSEPLSKEAAQNLLNSFESRHRGSSRSGRPALLDPGWDIKTLGISQADAQFLESRKFSISDVARWFRLPPHKIGDLEKATFSNIEEQERNFVNDAVMPWAVRLELEALSKLITADRVYTKIDVRGLLRGNSKDRAEYYKTMRDLGVFSIDEIRELEDLNPLGPASGGDLRLVPMNMMPVASAARGVDNTVSRAAAVVEDGLARLAVKEQRATAKALENKDDLAAWSTEFFSRHHAHLIETMTPGAAVLGELLALSDNDVRAAVAEQATVMVERSIAALLGKRKPTCETPRDDADRLVANLKGLRL